MTVLRTATFMIASVGLTRSADATPQQDTLAKISASVDSLVQHQMTRRQIDGASLVVMHKGRVLKSSAYGVANQATGEKVTTRTAFFIASITKAFTTATVLRLVQDGQLQLGDTVGAFVTGLPIAWRSATIRDLLGMTSGTPESGRDLQRGIGWPDYQTHIDSAASKPVNPRGVRVYYPEYRWPSAGMFIAAEQLASFVDALGAGKVLGPAMLEAYWEPVKLTDGKVSDAFLGSWTDVGSSLPGRVAIHEGGVRATAWYVRDTGLTIVALTNLQGGLPIQWVEPILRLYAPVAR